MHTAPSWIDRDATERLPRLCAQGEGQTLEFKQSLPAQGHDIAKSIAAFASSNSGEVLYGVSDDGRIIGLPEAGNAEGRDRISRRILGAAKEIRPPVHPQISWACRGNDVVCFVKVEKGFDALYYSNQRPFIRRGASSRPAEPAEVEETFRERYAINAVQSVLPSTRQIAKRMTDVMKRMSVGRHEPLAVADLARAMDLRSPADLDAILSGLAVVSQEVVHPRRRKMAVPTPTKFLQEISDERS